jgi:PAS domain S-box-containing protein
MKKLFSFNSVKKSNASNEFFKEIQESQKSLKDVALITAELAKDISTSLKDYFDDFLLHINTTGKLLQDALIVTDTSGNIQNINPIAEQLFKYQSNELRNVHISELFSGDKLPKNFDMEKFSNEVNFTYNLEQFMGRRKDNSLFYVNITSSKIVKEDNSEFYIILVMPESGDLKNNISNSEEYFKIFSETSPDIIIIHNKKSILSFNKKLLDTTFYTSQEIEHLNPLKIFSTSELENILSHEKSNYLEHYESILQTKNNTMIHVSVTSKPIIWQGKNAKIKILHDISPYKNKEQYLEFSKLRYKSIVNNTMDLICCYNSNFIITFSNQTFLDFFNLEKHEVLNRSLFDFIPEEDRDELFENISNLSIDNSFHRGIHRLKVGDDVSWHDWINKAIFDKDGNFVEYLSVTRNLSSYNLKNLKS